MRADHDALQELPDQLALSHAPGRNRAPTEAPSPAKRQTAAATVHCPGRLDRSAVARGQGVDQRIAAARAGTLGIDSDDWLKQVRGVGPGYWRAVGRAKALAERAKAMGQR
jgi:hypothetical protein